MAHLCNIMANMLSKFWITLAFCELVIIRYRKYFRLLNVVLKNWNRQVYVCLKILLVSCGVSKHIQVKVFELGNCNFDDFCLDSYIFPGAHYCIILILIFFAVFYGTVFSGKNVLWHWSLAVAAPPSLRALELLATLERCFSFLKLIFFFSFLFWKGNKKKKSFLFFFFIL